MHVHTYIYIYMHIHKYRQLYTTIHVYIYIYVLYIYIHTYKYIYICAYAQRQWYQWGFSRPWESESGGRGGVAFHKLPRFIIRQRPLDKIALQVQICKAIFPWRAPPVGGGWSCRDVPLPCNFKIAEPLRSPWSCCLMDVCLHHNLPLRLRPAPLPSMACAALYERQHEQPNSQESRMFPA